MGFPGPRNCKNPLLIKSKVADGAEIGHI